MRNTLPAYRLGGKLIRIRKSDLDALREPIPAGSAGGVLVQIATRLPR
jgi:hypothetical protein